MGQNVWPKLLYANYCLLLVATRPMYVLSCSRPPLQLRFERIFSPVSVGLTDTNIGFKATLFDSCIMITIYDLR